jgi:hypothetical protein
MLLVKPKAVIATDHPMNVENGRVDEATHAKNTAELALREAIFEAVHGE